MSINFCVRRDKLGKRIDELKEVHEVKKDSDLLKILIALHPSEGILKQIVEGENMPSEVYLWAVTCLELGKIL